MKKGTLFAILGGCLLLSLSPVYIYWIKFGFNGLSGRPSDWIGYGSYIGGTVGPIVSLLSLLILGWITFMVAKNSSKESFKHQVLLKRTEAYQEMTKHMVKLNLLQRKFSIQSQYMANLNEYSKETGGKELAETFRAIQDHFTVIHECHQFIVNFKLTYGYLYKYDFECQEFKDLLKSSTEMKQFAIDMETAILESDEEKRKSIKEPEEFQTDSTAFVNSLLQEMDLEPYF